MDNEHTKKHLVLMQEELVTVTKELFKKFIKLTSTNTHGIADRYDFADIFGTVQYVYVTHRNNGTIYSTPNNYNFRKTFIHKHIVLNLNIFVKQITDIC